MIGQLFDLFMLIGAAVLAVIAYRAGKNKAAQRPHNAVLLDSVRDDIANDAKTQQKAIEDALTGKTPADALADLGNRRRS